MARTPDPLLQPLAIRGVTLRNRVMSTAHATGYAEGGLPGERYQLYHEQKAKGGIALTMFGGSSAVSADSPFGHIDVSSDRCIAPFRAFAQRIHRHGAAIMCQISHLGRRSRADKGSWLPIVAPSATRDALHRGFAKEMERHDILRIIDDFAAAARRCREAGLDGVELLATSHLIGQFLSPASNRRTDAYGGSFENRCRFAQEVIEAVRGAIGDGILSFRLSGDEMLEGGLSAADCIAIARHVSAPGRLDALNVLGGNAVSEVGIARNIPGMGTPTAPFLKMAAGIRAATRMPVFHATRITDVETARHAIASGMIDMVSMTRGHIADPDIVAKLKDDAVDRIRPCVGARYCLDGAVYGGGMVCMHNPATGRERTVPQHIRPAEGRNRSVVVVGGGPAGLEAARVSALRGHRVRLFEAAEKFGGQVLIASRAHGRAELAEIVGWLEREAIHAKAALELGVFIESSHIAALHADVVIDATGGLPSFGEVVDPEGLLISTWDLLSGAMTPEGEILLYDEHGGHQGLSCAVTLARNNHVKLTMATPERAFGIELGAANRPQYLEACYETAVAMRPDTKLIRVARRANRMMAVLRNAYTGREENVEFDHIVVEAGATANTALYDALSPLASNKGKMDLGLFAAGNSQPVSDQGFDLWRIGDAVSHRGIHAAVLDARRLCQSL